MRRRDFLRFSMRALTAATIAPNIAVFAGERRRGETRRILYVTQFSQGTPQSMGDVVNALGGSSFNVLILSFLHASVTGGKLTLSYNGNPFPWAASPVPALLARLRSGFARKKRITISIGGWTQLSTFEAIRAAGVPAFVRQMSEEVILPLGLDGIDLDLEPRTVGMDQWVDVHREFGKMLADLTNEYKRLHPAHLVTHAPISAIAAQIYAMPEPLPGLPDGLLAATRIAGGNNIDWLNVQFYEGGAVSGDIADFYRNALAVPLMKIKTRSGVRDPIRFLTPLFEPQAKQPLAFCRATVAAIDRRCRSLHAGNVSGVGLWDYDQIAASIGEWSSGLESALHAR